MPKPLVFDLFALDVFRPADLGWLTPTGVVRADANGDNPNEGIVAVRAIGHVLAGRRAAFIEVRLAPEKQSLLSATPDSGESLFGSWGQQVPWKSTNG